MTIGRSTRDEESPLLYAELARERVYRTPFPWSQLSILFALQIARYMPSYVSRTIIPDLIRSLGIAKGEKNVGYYVGLLVSTLYLAETVSIFNLSRLSDQIGRKFVYLTCALCISIFISGFGLSTTLWELILCQAFLGASRATRGVTRSMLAETIDSTDIARALAYLETSWYFAGAIGSKIGGSLSRPADQFPLLFGSSEFLKKYPYFLPCAICSILLLTAWLVGNIFLRETLAEPLPLSALFKTKEYNERTRRPLPLRTIFVPGIIIAAINLSSIYLIQAFYSETEVLYLSTPINDGGLGLSLRAIGTCTSIRSAVIGISHLLIFPRVHDKWGSKYVFVLGLSASIPQFLMWPLMNWIARRDGHSDLVWFTLAVQICCSALNEFAWLAISVFITQSYGSRAAVVGFCEAVAGVSNTIAPAISNSLFSLSIDKGYLGGYMVYFVFVCSVVMALCASSLLPRDDKVPNQQ